MASWTRLYGEWYVTGPDVVLGAVVSVKSRRGFSQQEVIEIVHLPNGQKVGRVKKFYGIAETHRVCEGCNQQFTLQYCDENDGIWDMWWCGCQTED